MVELVLVVSGRLLIIRGTLEVNRVKGRQNLNKISAIR